VQTVRLRKAAELPLTALRSAWADQFPDFRQVVVVVFGDKK
jgi:hypothetical protein